MINLTDARMKELGIEGMLAPFQLSCSQHEGAGKFALMQWDGKAQALKFSLGISLTIALRTE